MDNIGVVQLSGERFPAPRPSVRTCVSLAILSHAVLLIVGAWLHSPVALEVGHLPAGISHWRFGRFDLYRVNPPLVRMVAALSVLPLAPSLNWGSYDSDSFARIETAVGIDFVNANGSRTFKLYSIARCACAAFSILGALVCFRWASELWGARSGLAAIVLWCFDPNILGNGALVMPDLPAASLGAAACYTFWRWLRRPKWATSIIVGVVLGLAELTKTTLLVLFAVWPMVWFLYCGRDWSAKVWRQRLRESGMLGLQVVLALYVLNIGYAFEGSLQPLGSYRFRSQAATGSITDGVKPGNRFANSFLARLPVPLPKNYLLGIDTQKLDFERGRPSYLHGEWRIGGWWYFYLHALAIKVPLGTWALWLISTAATVGPVPSVAHWRDEAALVIPAVAILAFISMQAGISIHFRYVLPMLPFAIVWAAKSASHLARRSNATNAVVALALGWFILSSAFCYPHSLSYFNELVGGPKGGHAFLLDSCISWGQDLLFLKHWYDAHPEARPFYLATTSTVDPRLAGIESASPPASISIAHGPGEFARLTPGWYAIDVNYLHGLPPTRRGERRDDWLGYLFKHEKPVASVGYTHYIYHVTAAASRGREVLDDG